MNKIFEKFKNDENTRNKFILCLVIVIGFIAIFVNLGSVKNKMKDPLVDKQQESLDKLYAKYEELKQQGKIVEENPTNMDDGYGTANENGDTDGDGISDYDEKNVFGTSVYLKDSDGDGIDDYAEIKNGTDPNCATGKNCGSSAVSIPETQTGTTTTSAEINGIDINSLDISKIREKLKEIAPENIRASVDEMTDEQVKTIFITLYQQANSTTKTAEISYIDQLKGILPAFTADQLIKIEAMDEEGIKNLLIDTGIADATLLSKFKSGELKNTVLGK